MKNPLFHEQSKHIDVNLHFISEVVSRGAIKVTYIGPEENPADVTGKIW